MPPTPIRIGLTKRRIEEDSDDEAVAPLSVSLLNDLEDVVNVETGIKESEESEDLFTVDIERDCDPNYV